MDLCCNAVGRLIGRQGDFGLEDDLTAVVDLVHIMDGDARVSLLSGHHRFVNMLAIKALAYCLFL